MRTVRTATEDELLACFWSAEGHVRLTAYAGFPELLPDHAGGDDRQRIR